MFSGSYYEVEREINDFFEDNKDIVVDKMVQSQSDSYNTVVTSILYCSISDLIHRKMNKELMDKFSNFETSK